MKGGGIGEQVLLNSLNTVKYTIVLLNFFGMSLQTTKRNTRIFSLWLMRSLR